MQSISRLSTSRVWNLLCSHRTKHLPYGVWSLGIVALELAYGYLPRKCLRKDGLVTMANNFLCVMNLKLQIHDLDVEKKENEKAKKKKRIKKSQVVDVVEKIEKDPLIRLPGLDKLLDNDYVWNLENILRKELELKLKEKKFEKNTMPMAYFMNKVFKKVKNLIFRRPMDGDHESHDETEIENSRNFLQKDGDHGSHDETEIEFSRDFLRIVKGLLDSRRCP